MRACQYRAKGQGRSRLSLFDTRQNIRHDLRLRLRALRAAVVEADAHRAGFHVATADDEHRVDTQLFRVGNLRLSMGEREWKIYPVCKTRD